MNTPRSGNAGKSANAVPRPLPVGPREELGGFAAGGEPLLVVRLVDALVDLGLREEQR